MRSILYEVFDNLRQQQSQTFEHSEHREKIVQQAILLFQEENMTITKAFRRLSEHYPYLKYHILHRWLNAYENEHGPIVGKQHRSHLFQTNYSPKQREEIIQQAILLFQEENITNKEVANRLGLKPGTLNRLLKYI